MSGLIVLVGLVAEPGNRGEPTELQRGASKRPPGLGPQQQASDGAGRQRIAARHVQHVVGGPANRLACARHLASQELLQQFLRVEHGNLRQFSRDGDRCASAHFQIGRDQPRSANASAASLVMPAQSPLATSSLGATQEPPTQTMFGRLR